MRNNLITDKFLWGFIVTSLLWTFIGGTILLPEGLQFFKRGLLLYLSYNAVMFFGFSAIISLLSLVFYMVGKLLKKSLNFRKTLFVTAIIIGVSSIGGSIMQKCETENPQTSLGPNSLQTQPNISESTKNRVIYQSTLDSFVALFPHEPSVEKATANYLTVRSYQASEVLRGEEFIFYSITFSIIDHRASFILSRNEAINYLNQILDSFSNSLSTKASDRYIKRPTSFIDFPAIEYKFDFVEEHKHLCNQGLFFLNKNKIVRISISFPKASESLIENKYELFKNSFALLNN